MRKNNRKKSSTALKLWKTDNRKTRIERLFDSLHEQQQLTLFSNSNTDTMTSSTKKEDTNKSSEHITKKDNNIINTTNKRKRSKKEHVTTTHYKLADNRVNQLLNISETLDNCIKVFDTVVDSMKYIETSIYTCDQEKNDLYHEIENIWEDARGGYVRYDQLKHVLIRRRAYKELEEECRPIFNFVKDNPDSIKKLKSAVAYIKERVAMRENGNKTYMPRVRDDLKVANVYNKMSEKEQQFVKECVDKRKIKYKKNNQAS